MKARKREWEGSKMRDRERERANVSGDACVDVLSLCLSIYLAVRKW